MTLQMLCKTLLRCEILLAETTLVQWLSRVDSFVRLQGAPGGVGLVAMVTFIRSRSCVAILMVLKMTGFGADFAAEPALQSSGVKL